jgi:outer membrane protein TolC
MRWQAVLGLAMVMAAAVGCKEQCFLTECDAEHYHSLGLPAQAEACPDTPAPLPTLNLPTPPTVLNPDQPIRYLSLAEALAMALEQGGGGSPALNGTTGEALVTFQGRSVVSPENPIRVLALEPAIAGTDIEASLSKFDARWVTSMTWTRTDQPVATALQTFEAAGTANVIQNDDASFVTSLLKPLPTGGVAGVTFRTDYELTNLPARVNPSYRPLLQFQFEQPLLQGFGVEINQLRAQHPGSLLTPFPTAGRVEGILITRVHFDQQRAEFERQLDVLAANVEIAYWNLYGAYWTLYSREQGLRQSFEAWRINKAKQVFGGTANAMDVAQARGQYESFRTQRLEALGLVLENEHQLRALLGLPAEDTTRLVPLDAPTLAPYRPDWSAALNDALMLRPELVLAREDLKLRQLDLINQKNLLMPDLRFTSTYDINGVGTHLDEGSGDPNNAFHNLATNQFHDWALGLRLEVPIGFRDAHAAVRAARLRLLQSYLTLRDQESRAARYLDAQYRQLVQTYEEIQTQQAELEALAQAVRGRFQEFVGGKIQLIVLLEAQRLYADVLRTRYAAVVEYNNALVRFEFAKGTLLQHDNVVISEGPLAPCAQVRAVDYERRRAHALVLREREHPVPLVSIPGPTGPCAAVPALPTSSAPSLPSLLEAQPPPPNDAEPPPAQRSEPGPAPAGPDLLPFPRPLPRGPTSAPAPAGQPLPETAGPLTASLGRPVAASVPAASGTAAGDMAWRPVQVAAEVDHPNRTPAEPPLDAVQVGKPVPVGVEPAGGWADGAASGLNAN